MYCTNQLFTATPLTGRRSVVTIQILDFSFCVVQPTSLVWTKADSVLDLTYDGTTCILAIVQFVKQSLEMYRVTKQWQLNRYMVLLTTHGIFYFLAYVLV